jgi:hypothetical protein
MDQPFRAELLSWEALVSVCETFVEYFIEEECHISAAYPIQIYGSNQNYNPRNYNNKIMTIRHEIFSPSIPSQTLADI